ncbi:Uncharacterised protein [Legionella donaldsonii]|uniref:Uncharacterized protein n=1 Tax=Legionella donaldsonii TaxID=45060 RepID=A0A378JBD9_9GAMM|nr:DUF6516 family protein [Legionella donaldsonii]STX44769.1 Uncharacterised protein [Legionella donaldsonii]
MGIGINKIEVTRTDPTPGRPHGIRYNLTFHDNHNQRILGFDNAHAIRIQKRGRYSGQIFQYDHVHRTIRDTGTPYEFVNASQLLEDFFKAVNSIMEVELRR